jgi:hypothetical protein
MVYAHKMFIVEQQHQHVPLAGCAAMFNLACLNTELGPLFYHSADLLSCWPSGSVATK